MTASSATAAGTSQTCIARMSPVAAQYRRRGCRVGATFVAWCSISAR